MLRPELEPPPPGRSAWRTKLYVIIFGHDTKAGRAFDLALIVSITRSVLVVMVDSVRTISEKYGS